MLRWSTYQTLFQIYHTQILYEAHNNLKVSSIDFYIFSLALDDFLRLLHKACLPFMFGDCNNATQIVIIQIGRKKEWKTKILV